MVPVVSQTSGMGFRSGGGGRAANEVGGHLLRSKFAHHADGGVAAGVACLDSPDLGPAV